MIEITRPALRYFGGKFRIAPWVIAHLPAHEIYVEPFGGGASILLQKRPAKRDVYNDLDGEIVNFFRMLREHPEALIEAITLTPFSREEFHRSFEPCAEPIERARRLYVRSWQGIGGKLKGRTGWRVERTTARGSSVVQDWSKVDYLWAIAKRLKQVFIECDDAFAVIERMDRPGTLFYLDPPYLQAVRSPSWRKSAYQYEMDDADHERLAELANGLDGMVVISGYPSAQYDEWYGDWLRVSRRGYNAVGNPTDEVLWISPAGQDGMAQQRFA